MVRAIIRPTRIWPNCSGQKGTRSFPLPTVSASRIAATIGPISSEAGRAKSSRKMVKAVESASSSAHFDRPASRGGVRR